MDSKACSEVLDILKYVPMEDYQKIPDELINRLYENADGDSNFAYNIAVPFSEQEISPEAKKILAEISEKYWA